MIITGFADTTVLAELDGVAVLRKPFNRAELCGAVRSIIAGSARQPGTFQPPAEPALKHR
jgi:hypothetical protein